MEKQKYLLEITARKLDASEAEKAISGIPVTDETQRLFISLVLKGVRKFEVQYDPETKETIVAPWKD